MRQKYLATSKPHLLR